MLRSHTFWLKATIVFQLLLALVHSFSFFAEPQATNEAERQMLELMTTVKSDLGAGFSPSMMDLFTALSACFSFAYLLGGLVNIVMLQKKADKNILTGVANVSLIVFVPCFLVMAWLTFLPPIVMTGLVVGGLVGTRFTIK